MYLKGELAAVDAAEEAADISAGITAADDPAEGGEGAASEAAGDSEAAVAVAVPVLSRSGRRAAFGGRGEEAPEAVDAAGEGGAEGKAKVFYEALC